MPEISDEEQHLLLLTWDELFTHARFYKVRTRNKTILEIVRGIIKAKIALRNNPQSGLEKN